MSREPLAKLSAEKSAERAGGEPPVCIAGPEGIDACLSARYPLPIAAELLDLELTFCCAEAYFLAYKYASTPRPLREKQRLVRAIAKAADADAARTLARKHSGRFLLSIPEKKHWDVVRAECMRIVLKHKFAQSAKARGHLLATGTRPIIVDPGDSLLPGANTLSLLLTERRAKLARKK